MESFNARRTIMVAAALVAVAVVGPTGRSSDVAVQGRTNANASVAAKGTFVAVTWGAATKERTAIR